MAMWTIKSVSGNSPGAAALRGCRILAVPDGGGGFSYRLLPATGGDWIATSASNPPSFTAFLLGGLNWNVSATTTLPVNPRNGATLSGSYSNNGGGARPESGEGSWQAEPTGGGPLPKPPKKGGAKKKSSAKSSGKLSKKSPSKSSSKKSPRKPTSKKSSAKSSRKRSS